jgi:hypothetical protein
MKHLIPSLQDDQKAADSVRPWRWPAGMKCPRGGSDAVEPRARCDHGLQRGNCVACAVRLGQPCALCTDWTSAICAESTWRPLAGWLVRGLWPWKLHATAMAAAADLPERTAPRGIHGLAGGIDETSHLDPTRPREHHGEADAGDQSAGSQGLARAVARRARAPRHRGLPRRGRATAERGRPPLRGLGPRRDKTDPDAPAAPVSLAVREHGRPATITPLIAAKVKGGAPCFTDADHMDHVTKADDDHRTVNQGAGAEARRAPDGTGVHGNTMEGFWSSRRHFLDRFRGISQPC